MMNMDDEYFLSRMDADIHGSLDAVKGVYEAPLTRANDIEIIHISKDEVRLSMKIREDHLNGNTVCHGAAIFTLIDDTFAFAGNLFEPSVAQNVAVSFHRPAISGTMESVSKKISDTRSLSVFEIMVYCEGKHIATAMCTGFKTSRK